MPPMCPGPGMLPGTPAGAQPTAPPVRRAARAARAAQAAQARGQRQPMPPGRRCRGDLELELLGAGPGAGARSCPLSCPLGFPGALPTFRSQELSLQEWGPKWQTG